MLCPAQINSKPSLWIESWIHDCYKAITWHNINLTKFIIVLANYSMPKLFRRTTEKIWFNSIIFWSLLFIACLKDSIFMRMGIEEVGNTLCLSSWLMIIVLDSSSPSQSRKRECLSMQPADWSKGGSLEHWWERQLHRLLFLIGQLPIPLAPIYTTNKLE